MKVNVIQILLGFAIALAMSLSLAWDTTGFIARYMIEPGNWYHSFNPDSKEVIATILAYMILLFSTGIVGISIVLLIKRIRSEYVEPGERLVTGIQKMILIQSGLGLLVAASALFVTGWGFPMSYTFVISDDTRHIMSFMPGRHFILAQTLSMVTIFLGIVSGVAGLVQLLLYRRR